MFAMVSVLLGLILVIFYAVDGRQKPNFTMACIGVTLIVGGLLL